MATEGHCHSSPLGPAANDGDAAALRLIQEITTNADKVQEEVLKEILSANADTEYLRRFDLGGATDRETFKAKLPVIDYEDVEADIERIADGDRSAILMAEPITQLLASSGTVRGKKKLIPATEAAINRRMAFLALIQPILNSCMPDLDKGKTLSFSFTRAEPTTAGGQIVSTGTMSGLKSDKFRQMYRILTSPEEAIFCHDHFQIMYVQMLCGLYHREEVVRFVGNHANSHLQAIRFLQLHYRELAHDISTGTLSPRITDDSLRTAVSPLLERPNPDLGRVILTECWTGNWEGILRRLWPNLKFVGGVLTGTMTQYVPALEHYSGGVPLVSIMYVATECCFGINLTPFCRPSEISYTFMPNMGYFEFVPLDSDGGEIVDLAEVEVGREYQVVVTNHAGLYRYRVGDVLQVTGFHNASPQFQFVRRMNVALSVDNEVTDEVELQRGVDSAARLLEEYETRVVDYTSYVEIKTIPAHYVIYLELLSKDLISVEPSVEVMESCCEAIEEELNARYRQGRSELRSIGALEIRVVREGTLDALMELAVSNGASISQYKVPRCVKLKPMVELLDSHVVASHLGRRLPTWT